jgi:hypothetical protein
MNLEARTKQYYKIRRTKDNILGIYSHWDLWTKSLFEERERIWKKKKREESDTQKISILRKSWLSLRARAFMSRNLIHELLINWWAREPPASFKQKSMLAWWTIVPHGITNGDESFSKKENTKFLKKYMLKTVCYSSRIRKRGGSVN